MMQTVYNGKYRIVSMMQFEKKLHLSGNHTCCNRQNRKRNISQALKIKETDDLKFYRLN